jgi:4-alpha-glucanotransferase
MTDRSAGILLHLSSLPGPWPVGDLGASAHSFIDYLADAGQSWWQMLPINPIGAGDSPYSTVSALAGETLFIDPYDLARLGWLKPSELPPATKASGGRADFAAARRAKDKLLKLAYERASPKLARRADFQAFQHEHRDWLDDYTLFVSLAEAHGTTDWSRWSDLIKRRDPASIRTARADLALRLEFHAFCQFLFERQWQSLRAHAKRRGIGLIGDIPIFVGYKSADVWSSPDSFWLDKNLRPTVVAGCPPDVFNKNGQMWGNALYRWPQLKQSGFAWWLKRLGRIAGQFDCVRLDHFIGFHHYWEIAASAKNARGGHWVKALGDDLFKVVAKKLPHLSVIAEDLGAVSPPVRALRDKYEFPGMKIGMFAFDGTAEAREHVPHAATPRSVIYTGTHDMPTASQWYEGLRHDARRGKAAAAQFARASAYLGAPKDGKTAAAALVRACLASPAEMCVLPWQDVLGQGAKHRMNVPGTAKGNWCYRAKKSEMTPALAAHLATLMDVFDR